jgi:TRAP-type uncharacterized transport system fused permease subunit
MSKKKFRLWYWIFNILAWIGLLTPLSIWIGLNFDKYVVQKSGFSVTTGGILAVLFIVLLLKYGIKRFGKWFWMSMLLAIVYCLDTVIHDALPLTFFAWLGVLLFTILGQPAKYFKHKLNVYVDEEVRTTARSATQTTAVKRNTNGRC